MDKYSEKGGSFIYGIFCRNVEDFNTINRLYRNLSESNPNNIVNITDFSTRSDDRNENRFAAVYTRRR